MDELLEQQPKYYDVIPEFNSAGRLCNYHTGGEGETVRVMVTNGNDLTSLQGGSMKSLTAL